MEVDAGWHRKEGRKEGWKNWTVYEARGSSSLSFACPTHNAALR